MYGNSPVTMQRQLRSRTDACIECTWKAIDTNTFPNAWIDTSKTVTELFEDAGNGNFKLRIDAQVGDPRWYKNVK